MLHALSIDVEDWYNATLVLLFEKYVPPSDAVVKSTERLLNLLSDKQIRATWFILGEVADAFPALIKRLAAAHQEIGVHGYYHHRVDSLKPKVFADELHRAKDGIEQAAGKRVLGFRAPAFSLSRQMTDYFEILKTAGFSYDSSVFPFRGSRYGDSTAPLAPFFINTPSGSILEVPVSVMDFGWFRLPCCGGGYFRHFPLGYTRFALRHLEKRQRPAVFYLHPYEIETEYNTSYFEQYCGPQELKGVFKWKAPQYRNRSQAIHKLHHILEHHKFSTMAEVFSVQSTIG
ncbi:MAG TPA: polysaccharide deacetylase family protein [Candidatus Paceibacterota bacterium]|nr:polysaccharide deacetylase family protein [Verrucomicrobiota bacterium]HRY50709.1 polysaccharide deacetylase family protein [Candidatus Paceibacterota bacterium]